MNLTPEQKTRLRLFMMDNAREENRYYRYDFLQDNCATRIRDIFDGGEYPYPRHLRRRRVLISGHAHRKDL